MLDHGQRFDPDTEVLVTVGATEALAAAVDSVADLPIDPRDRQEVVVEVLKTALAVPA